MRFSTIIDSNIESLAVLYKSKAIPMDLINLQADTNWSTQLFDMISNGEMKPFSKWFQQLNHNFVQNVLAESLSVNDVTFAPLYRHPRKIWGIGLNYADHASDLSEKTPSIAPASFMKPDTTIIGSNDHIKIPNQSERTTAEAELGIIIGETCKDVSEEDAMNVVAGFTTIIDMTAEDILRLNPRYLTRAKSFDTFFSFGPALLTPDEIDHIHNLSVSTMINGQVHRKNLVANMTFSPEFLISFHSKVMTLCPGDIISTGTPGAVVIRHEDTVSCEIDGFPTLTNQVIDLKSK